MVKLRRLKSHQHRRIETGTKLVFDDGMNVLLGRNGSGKTTEADLDVRPFGFLGARRGGVRDRV